jgi:tripartite-type tricarboxylate transporter receptor subunit TctC
MLMMQQSIATERHRRRARAAAGIAVGIALALSAPGLAAQDAAGSAPAWPARAVRLVVPSSPGGGTDLYARLLALGLTDALKQTFVVDNRPGAAGNIGAEIVARSAPDGYTFLVSANPAIAVNPSLYKNLSYNAERDFIPVARGVITPFVFTSHPSVPAKTLPALLALGKREPGKLPYGTAGTGSPPHLGVRMFEEATGARFIHVPYKGLGQAVQGLLRGEVGFILADVATVLPYIRSGRVLALAVTQPTPQLPGTPTAAAAGYPIEVYGSFSVVAPAGTPPAIIQRLSAEVIKAMKSPAIKEKIEGQAFIPVFDTPDAFAASLKKERQMWADVIRRNNIVAE